jgi:hypothetical protein
MTKIINFLAGPGAGKSTVSAGLFYKLKLANYNVEYVQEFAKDLTWEDRQNTLGCQPYVFGKQLWRIERLIGKVDIIVTDSPLILSAVYDKVFKDGHSQGFCQSVIENFNRFNNINYLLRRTKAYNKVGRNQTEEESVNIDTAIESFLNKHNIPFKETIGLEETVDLCFRESTQVDPAVEFLLNLFSFTGE